MMDSYLSGENAYKRIELSSLSLAGGIEEEKNSGVPTEMENSDGIDSSSHPLTNGNDVPSRDNSQAHQNTSRTLRDLQQTLAIFSKQSLFFLVCLLVISTISLITFVLVLSRPIDESPQHSSSSSIMTIVKTSFNADKIAFGSCTAYDLREMTIWNDAIIPSEPDVWIWTGDMAYLDDSEVNCRVYSDSEDWQRNCNCTATWLRHPPFSCHGGDVDYANDRWIKTLSDGPYNDFLQYMCPKAIDSGEFPPDGSNPNKCDRGIFGIYDDHDFGANDANGRENSKHDYKNMYLDAIGDPQDSPRRGLDRGAWYKYTLNEGIPGKDVDIIILDQRYERQPIPCENRREYCEKVVLSSNSDSTISAGRIAWCNDFLKKGTLDKGSCCSKDEDIYFGWCKLPSSKDSPFYREACDVTYDKFGMRSFVLDDDGTLRLPTAKDSVDHFKDSPFCEVLGKSQRRWLRKVAKESKAAVKIFISGSVLFYDPTFKPCGSYRDPTTGDVQQVNCRCSGDNMDCFSVAQLELAHIMSSVSGCSIVLTGDYHFSDIKAIRSGSDTPYAPFYGTANNSQTIYQVMASGMSESTGIYYSCEDFRLDPMKLRTHPECDFVTGPNFGRIILDYDEKHRRLNKIVLQVLSGRQKEKVLLETIIDPETCNKGSTMSN